MQILRRNKFLVATLQKSTLATADVKFAAGDQNQARTWVATRTKKERHAP
jgi:hypothetical protein